MPIQVFLVINYFFITFHSFLWPIVDLKHLNIYSILILYVILLNRREINLHIFFSSLWHYYRVDIWLGLLLCQLWRILFKLALIASFWISNWICYRYTSWKYRILVYNNLFSIKSVFKYKLITTHWFEIFNLFNDSKLMEIIYINEKIWRYPKG